MTDNTMREAFVLACQEYGPTISFSDFECGWDACMAWQAAQMECKHSGSVQVVGEPVAWVRQHPDGALTNQFLEDAVIEPVRRNSGGWIPLYRAPTTSITAQELDALRKDAERGRMLIEHGEWIRRNHDTDEAHALLAIRLPYDADLSCKATREDAIDAAIAQEPRHD